MRSFSSFDDNFSPIISGLVDKNWPNLINVVPISCIELHNFSSSLKLSFLFEVFEKEIEKMNKNNFKNCKHRNLSGGIVAIHSGWKI